jgi:hypothetical protein
MIRSGYTVGRNTKESSLSDQLRRFKPRELEENVVASERKKDILLVPKSNRPVNPAHESLMQKCIQVVVDNFEQRPVKEIIPPAQMAEITKQLPVGLSPIIGAKFVYNENYWKRCCVEKYGWQNCHLHEHGLLWKQMYFEKLLTEKLEDFDIQSEDPEIIFGLIDACMDYIFTIKFNQLPSHIDLSEICALLPNVTRLDITYGVNKIGMSYERMLFGMKISDATGLAKVFDRTETLTSVVLSGNLIDDDLLRMLMTGLIKNNTITALDFSHNKITNHGARLLSKLLGENSVITYLNLADNNIHGEGGRYLARGLRENDSLLYLNLRLNKLGDEGCRLLFEGLQDNVSVTNLNVASNGAGTGAAQTLFSIIRDTEHKLAVLDISGNEFQAEHFELMRLSMSGNRALIGLDIRANPGYAEATRAVAEIDKMVHTNEYHSRKGEGHP